MPGRGSGRPFGGAGGGGRRFGAGGYGSGMPRTRTLGTPAGMGSGRPSTGRMQPFPGIGPALRNQRPQTQVGPQGADPYNLANGSRRGGIYPGAGNRRGRSL